MESTRYRGTVHRIRCTQPTERDRTPVAVRLDTITIVQQNTVPYLPAAVYSNPLDRYIPNDGTTSTVFLKWKVEPSCSSLGIQKDSQKWYFCLRSEQRQMSIHKNILQTNSFVFSRYSVESSGGQSAPIVPSAVSAYRWPLIISHALACRNQWTIFLRAPSCLDLRRCATPTV